MGSAWTKPSRSIARINVVGVNSVRAMA